MFCTLFEKTTLRAHCSSIDKTTNVWRRQNISHSMCPRYTDKLSHLGFLQNETTSLEVLSSYMDPAEIKFIRKDVIKERGAEVFRKIRPSFILWKPFKATAKSRTAVGYLKTNCQQPTQFYQRPFIPYIQLLATAHMNKFEICFQWCNDHFNPRMLLFSVGNGAMNTLWLLATAQLTMPQYWQRRNELLRDGGFTKRMGNLSSAFKKADTSALPPMPAHAMNLIPASKIRFRIANSCSRWLGIFEWLSQDGRLFLNTYQMNIISAGSISLDSTFKSNRIHEKRWVSSPWDRKKS